MMDVKKQNPLRICLASDFFYPNTGGVESHIWQLAQCLLAKGHKVVVVTHSYEDRKGVRWMTNGLKVYYIPVLVAYNQASVPTLFATFCLIRKILIREQINLVHGHSAFSAIGLETMMHAKTIGIKTVFTDHSLFGFADASAIVINKLLQLSLTICDRVICVSLTSKENTCLRAGIRPEKISVISNAVDTGLFTPDPSKRTEGMITVLVVSRLVYRKGCDLLVRVIPVICSRFPRIRFLIGGDGPKRILFEEMIERHQLQIRVQLLGSIPHERVRDLLVQGDIFLNCSLTEAFCMAIVEAASCGLQVVSTNVGGIPEVLPPSLMWLCEPTVDSLVRGLVKAVRDKEMGHVVDPYTCHTMIRSFYNWRDIADRTLTVYHSCFQEEEEDPQQELSNRLWSLLDSGSYGWGPVFVMLVMIEHILSLVHEWWTPRESISVEPNYPTHIHFPSTTTSAPSNDTPPAK